MDGLEHDDWGVGGRRSILLHVFVGPNTHADRSGANPELEAVLLLHQQGQRELDMEEAGKISSDLVGA